MQTSVVNEKEELEIINRKIIIIIHYNKKVLVIGMRKNIGEVSMCEKKIEKILLIGVYSRVSAAFSWIQSLMTGTILPPPRANTTSTTTRYETNNNNNNKVC